MRGFHGSYLFDFSRTFRHRLRHFYGHLNFAEGGAAHDVIEGIKKYGIVPQEVYP